MAIITRTSMTSLPIKIHEMGIASEQDLMTIRQCARQISAKLGFSAQDQVRIATAVSEMARTAVGRATRGSALFFCELEDFPGTFGVRIRGLDKKLHQAMAIEPDNEPDPYLDAAILSVHRMMDDCFFEADNGTTTVTLLKKLPSKSTLSPSAIVGIGANLAAGTVGNSYSEIHLQNHELLATLAELRQREEDLVALTRELEDTNRGVMALYAEIEEKADRLKRSDDMKSRFLSNTSHELRTPLSSIRALAKLMLDRIDGDLTPGQQRQMEFIHQAVSDLGELVNDLLDLAKIEAGKVDVVYDTVEVANLFSALKGMMRPLANNPRVDLVFASPPGLTFVCDENKVAQILRNLISNALKFTESGEVCVTAELQADGQRIRFAVADTGIGIAPENIHLVFEEFEQVENHLQKGVKGTGLGLPLCRKLAVLLGGKIDLDSQPGRGSVFKLELPVTASTAQRAA